VLKYGSLPVDFNPQMINSVSAQYGHTSLDAGLISGILGLSLVIIYLFIYRFFGGGHRWSGLDPARLGARAPWRSGSRRTGRPQRPVPPVALGGATPDQPHRRGDQQH
jgi:hypothetical protein